ncbi:MAG TPA: class A beta-lactamase, subclass A2 [Fluviicola sp.]|nr:class A beta-lactamase, subclass A2 [Fluviicola sp.]
MKLLLLSIALISVLYNCGVNAQQPPKGEVETVADLKKNIEQFLSSYEATVGVSVKVLEDGESFTINDSVHHPTLSTYKFPLALAVLHKVDNGKLKLDQTVHVTKEMLHPGTWSPYRDAHPEGNVDPTIAELLEYTVSRSDNNTTDILFELLGGTEKVHKYISGLGIKGMMIAATEYEMGESEKVYDNWSKSVAMASLLEKFYTKKVLSDENTAFLVKLMINTPTGMNRLKGLLPPTATVAHKTGTSGANEEGITAAVNDIGIITLPNGKHIAIAVFVTDSKESFETNEYLIAHIAGMVWDHYAGPAKPVVRTVDLTDESRNRAVPLKIYESTSADNQKVVILSGGYLSTNDKYSFIANKLADEGYLVVSIQHDLEGDAPIAQEGNIYELRMPVWKRGDSTILFVCEQLMSTYPQRRFNELVLIGHSNGGDMSLLFAQNHPDWVTHVITLDHRRMPIPLSSQPKVLSFRAGDTKADTGVLPNAEAQKKYGIQLIDLGPDAKHGDLCDRAGEALKQQILKDMLQFLK